MLTASEFMLQINIFQITLQDRKLRERFNIALCVLFLLESTILRVQSVETDTILKTPLSCDLCPKSVSHFPDHCISLDTEVVWAHINHFSETLVILMYAKLLSFYFQELFVPYFDYLRFLQGADIVRCFTHIRNTSSRCYCSTS